MSQQLVEQMDKDGQPQGSPQTEIGGMPGQGGVESEDEFSLGLDAALNVDGPDEADADPHKKASEGHGRTAPEDKALAPPEAEISPEPEGQPPLEPSIQSVEPPASPPEAEPNAPGRIEMPEHLQSEFERLEAIDPELARMALEDSADGQSIRDRLEEYGAAIAHDHARLVVLTRQQRRDMEQMRREQAMRDAQAQQAHFMGVMRQEHPDFYGLITGNDQAAQARFRNEMLSWIQNKPYVEAAPLMQIFQNSRDPRQVAGLLTQFKSERAAASRPDPTGAFAVPGRGGTVAPVGIGDKDDFDAGLDAGLSSE